MKEKESERERERNTLIHFSWLLAAAEPAGPGRERELIELNKREEESLFWGVCTTRYFFCVSSHVY